MIGQTSYAHGMPHTIHPLVLVAGAGAGAGEREGAGVILKGRVSGPRASPRVRASSRDGGMNRGPGLGWWVGMCREGGWGREGTPTSRRDMGPARLVGCPRATVAANQSGAVARTGLWDPTGGEACRRVGMSVLLVKTSFTGPIQRFICKLFVIKPSIREVASRADNQSRKMRIQAAILLLLFAATVISGQTISTVNNTIVMAIGGGIYFVVVIFFKPTAKFFGSSFSNDQYPQYFFL